MRISAEISYYTLQGDYNAVIEQFIAEIQKNKHLEFEMSSMSSIVTGKYEEVMKLIQHQMKPFLEKYPSVFVLKISNACGGCKI